MEIKIETNRDLFISLRLAELLLARYKPTINVYAVGSVKATQRDTVFQDIGDVEISFVSSIFEAVDSYVFSDAELTRTKLYPLVEANVTLRELFKTITDVWQEAS